MAEQWFLNNGWSMVRTQPAVTILGMVTPSLVAVLRRFIPRLSYFGHMVIARLGKGGAPDYTGYQYFSKHHFSMVAPEWRPASEYRACEVKEASGNSMPASRLDVSQRAFLSALPVGCAFVGIFWLDHSKFTVHKFIEKGAYRYEKRISAG
jgi:hypothetical protein